jgi:glutathione S-transferase
MKLYGHQDSGHVFKVKFCMDSLNLDYDYEVIDIFSPVESRNLEFNKLSKFNEVPLLVDNNQVFIQSDAILVYLAKKYKTYGGESEQTLQKCLEWLVWEANKIGMCLPQIRCDYMGFKDVDGSLMSLSAGAKEWLTNRYYHDAGIIDKELSDGRKFILGARVSIADFALSGYLMYQGEFGDLAVPANVLNWLGRLKQLPNYQAPQELLK